MCVVRINPQRTSHEKLRQLSTRRLLFLCVRNVDDLWFEFLAPETCECCDGMTSCQTRSLFSDTQSLNADYARYALVGPTPLAAGGCAVLGKGACRPLCNPLRFGARQVSSLCVQTNWFSCFVGDGCSYFFVPI